MLEFLLSQLIADGNYLYLTLENKAALERLVYTAPKDLYGKPLVSNEEIIDLLGFAPQCGKPPANPQIKCTWTEGERAVRAYFFLNPETGYQEFQRWDAAGFDNAN